MVLASRFFIGFITWIGQYAAGWEGLSLFIALARMVTFCKEGAVRLSVWALRARSYKTKAEA